MNTMKVTQAVFPVAARRLSVPAVLQQLFAAIRLRRSDAAARRRDAAASGFSTREVASPPAYIPHRSTFRF